MAQILIALLKESLYHYEMFVTAFLFLILNINIFSLSELKFMLMLLMFKSPLEFNQLLTLVLPLFSLSHLFFISAISLFLLI